jgi:hypothetical protein
MWTGRNYNSSSSEEYIHDPTADGYSKSDGMIVDDDDVNLESYYSSSNDERVVKIYNSTYGSHIESHRDYLNMLESENEQIAYQAEVEAYELNINPETTMDDEEEIIVLLDNEKKKKPKRKATAKMVVNCSEVSCDITTFAYTMLEWKFLYVEKKQRAKACNSCACDRRITRLWLIHIQNRFTREMLILGTSCVEYCGPHLQMCVRIAERLKRFNVPRDRHIGWEFPKQKRGKRGRWRIKLTPGHEITKEHYKLDRYFNERQCVEFDEQYDSWVMYITVPRREVMEIASKKETVMRLQMMTSKTGGLMVKFMAYLSKKDADKEERQAKLPIVKITKKRRKKKRRKK